MSISGAPFVRWSGNKGNKKWSDLEGWVRKSEPYAAKIS
jgi:hypothetical protein